MGLTLATLLPYLLNVLNELPAEIPEAEAVYKAIATGEGGIPKIESIISTLQSLITTAVTVKNAAAAPAAS